MATTPLIRARIAVSVLFVINGFALSTWLPRLAELQFDLGLNDAQLGLVLAAGAAGGLLVGPLGGYLVAHSSSARVSVWCYLLIVPALPLIGLAPSGWLLGAVLLWLGALDAVMDGAMNAHGLRVQQRYGRSVINSFHGFWSLGTVAGAVVGTVSLAIGLSIAWMLAGVAAVSVVALALTARWLLPGRDPVSHDADELARAEATATADPGSVHTGGYGRVLTRATALLGLFTLLAVIIEDIPARWSSIYLTDIGAPAALVGIGFTAFTIAMTVGRFAGDPLVNRFTELVVVRVSMVCSGIALAVALLVGTTWAYIGACVVIGLGVATLFPAAMHAATQIPGVRPAMGVATVGWLARGGFVLAPIAVGAVAERFGIAWGLTVPILAAALLVPLSAILRPPVPDPIP
jgi:MFS family permease